MGSKASRSTTTAHCPLCFAISRPCRFIGSLSSSHRVASDRHQPCPRSPTSDLLRRPTSTRPKTSVTRSRNKATPTLPLATSPPACDRSKPSLPTSPNPSDTCSGSQCFSQLIRTLLISPLDTRIRIGRSASSAPLRRSPPSPSSDPLSPRPPNRCTPRSPTTLAG